MISHFVNEALSETIATMLGNEQAQKAVPATNVLPSTTVKVVRVQFIQVFLLQFQGIMSLRHDGLTMAKTKMTEKDQRTDLHFSIIPYYTPPSKKIKSIS